MLPNPIEQPAPSRPDGEALSFDDSCIIYRDLQQGYVEYQFEELRLRDIRAAQYGRELLRSSYANPLARANLASRAINSPTINTRFALEELGPLLQGTPTLKLDGAQQPAMQERTIDFSGLRLSVADMEKRNEARGLGAQE